MVSRSEIKRGIWMPYENNFLNITPVGSVAYKLGLVAAGRSSLFATLQPKNEWDICAGNCIVNEAGGFFLICMETKDCTIQMIQKLDQD